MRSLFPLKDKNYKDQDYDYKDRVLPIKEIFLVFHVISVTPNVM